MYSLGRGGWVGAVCTFWYERPFVSFSLRVSFVSGAVNTQDFVWKFFMRYI